MVYLPSIILEKQNIDSNVITEYQKKVILISIFTKKAHFLHSVTKTFKIIKKNGWLYSSATFKFCVAIKEYYTP